MSTSLRGICLLWLLPPPQAPAANPAHVQLLPEWGTPWSTLGKWGIHLLSHHCIFSIHGWRVTWRSKTSLRFFCFWLSNPHSSWAQRRGRPFIDLKIYYPSVKLWVFRVFFFSVQYSPLLFFIIFIISSLLFFFLTSYCLLWGVHTKTGRTRIEKPFWQMH